MQNKLQSVIAASIPHVGASSCQCHN